MIDLNSIAVPVFIGSIILEVLISSFKKAGLYNWKDTLANLTIGVTGLLVGIATRGIALSCYYFAYHYQIFRIDNPVVYWCALFILNDIVFYFFHRLGHESRFFWSAHVNHHSSREYNFSTALRIPFMFALYRFLFWTPLGFLGFEPIDILFMNAMCMIYQFFLHVKWIKKLGWLEYIFNTPSHHRAHHASNHQYIDKNYGGVLIIWDRVLGTFQEENEKPVYGITERLDSYNPVKIVFHEFIDMLKDAVATGSVVGFFKVVFGKPGYDYRKTLKSKEGQKTKTITPTR